MSLRPIRTNLPSLLGPILVALLLAGCGHEEGFYPVSGTVRLDGEPLADGTINFIDPQGEVGGAGGAIEQGRYSFLSPPGPKRVEIRAVRDTGEVHFFNPGEEFGQNEAPSPIMEQYIPEQYNLRSTLTAEVSEGGKNTIDFDLSSSP